MNGELSTCRFGSPTSFPFGEDKHGEYEQPPTR